jgi:FixJ family two-component response regulator
MPQDHDIAIVDVQMPGMGGLNLQSHLASSGRPIPIAFVTGYPDAGALRQPE